MTGRWNIVLLALTIAGFGYENAWADDPGSVAGTILALQTTRPVAEVVALVGKATVNRSQSKDSILLAVSDVLYERDLLMTNASSKVRIRFADDSQVTLSEFSTLELTTAQVRTMQGTRQIFLTLTAGVFRAVVRLLTDRESFVLRTPTATAAVRGTEFGAVLKPESTGVFVKQGRVAVSNQDPTLQGAVTLNDGEGTDVALGQPPTPPKQWGAARVKALMEATDIP
ncbi:MAG: FecR family protein [Nitrospiraceae bacterium]